MSDIGHLPFGHDVWCLQAMYQIYMVILGVVYYWVYNVHGDIRNHKKESL